MAFKRLKFFQNFPGEHADPGLVKHGLDSLVKHRLDSKAPY